ncbi:MAG: 2OG-Fe(II) oxygenase [Dongiaceae bacterium]
MRQPAARLTVGDRAPNFVLPDRHGKFQMFYERVKGNPVVLFLCAAERAADLAELRVFAQSQAAFAAAGIDLFLINRASVAETAALAGDLDLAAPLLADPEGAVTAGFRAAAGLDAGGAACFLLDPNQRLLDLRGNAIGQADWALLRLAELRRPAEALRLAAVAPVLVVPQVLDRGACEDLIGRWETEGHDEGTVTSMIAGEEIDRVYHGMKKRRDHSIMDPALLRVLVDVIGRRLAPELDKAFGFNRFRFDRFLVTCYDAARGDYFRVHRDNLSPGTADRRFALTLNLNSEGHDGGNLRFPEYGPHLYRPETGAAIVFSCSLLHEALPVTRGRRFTLLSFLRAPAAAKPPDLP